MIWLHVSKYLRMLINCKLYGLIITFVLVRSIAYSQSCHFDAYYNQNISENSGKRLIVDSLDRKIEVYKGAHDFRFRDKIVVPVVVHVVWKNDIENIPDIQIFSQIDALNRAFQSIKPDGFHLNEFSDVIGSADIEFCLAGVGPFGEEAIGITRNKTDIDYIGATKSIYYSSDGGIDAWDTKSFMNIWVCALPDGLLGYGTSPGMVVEQEDGIVIDYKYFGSLGRANNSLPFNLGKTLVHEVGHYLNLLHPWGLLKYECEEDDLVEDTPFQFSTYRECPAQPQSSCGQVNMTMNYMNEVDDDCMFFFTNGQVERMRISLNLFRNGLVHNSFCSSKKSTVHGLLTILPNPATNWIHLKTDSEKPKIVSIQVYNILGQSVQNFQMQTNEYVPINIADFTSGLYFFQILDEGQNEKIPVVTVVKI